MGAKNRAIGIMSPVSMLKQIAHTGAGEQQGPGRRANEKNNNRNNAFFIESPPGCIFFKYRKYLAMRVQTPGSRQPTCVTLLIFRCVHYVLIGTDDQGDGRVVAVFRL